MLKVLYVTTWYGEGRILIIPLDKRLHRRNIVPNYSFGSRRGLYLSDVPLHDATRDLVLMSEQFEADYKLTRNLELLTDKLQQTYRELDGEKQKTDR